MSEFPSCRIGNIKTEIKPKKPSKKSSNKRTEPLVKNKCLRCQLSAGHLLRLKDLKQRIDQITPKVNTQAPKIDLVRANRVDLMRRNAIEYMKRTKVNIDLVTELSKYKRTHGAVNSYRNEELVSMSGLPLAKVRLEQIDEHNRELFRRIESINAEYDAKENIVAPQYFTKPFQMNEEPLKKYKNCNIKMPRTNEEHWKLFRPRVYFDIEMKGVKPLGRIIIELYTEAAPYVVLEIMHACRSHNYQKILIKRAFPNLWMDIEMPLAMNSLLENIVEYDSSIINHSLSYVLSFSKNNIKGFRDKLLFSISFNPINVPDGSRIGFGKVITGGKLIDYLKGFGTKNGKLSRTILLTGCGIV